MENAASTVPAIYAHHPISHATNIVPAILVLNVISNALIINADWIEHTAIKTHLRYHFTVIF